MLLHVNHHTNFYLSIYLFIFYLAVVCCNFITLVPGKRAKRCSTACAASSVLFFSCQPAFLPNTVSVSLLSFGQKDYLQLRLGKLGNGIVANFYPASSSFCLFFFTPHPSCITEFLSLFICKSPSPCDPRGCLVFKLSTKLPTTASLEK